MIIRPFAISLATIVVAAAMLAGPVAAAEAPPSFGFVDVPSVFEKYDKTIKSKALLEDLEKTLRDQFENLAPYKLLDDKERKELRGLVTKAAPAPADSDRIKALQSREKDLSKELADLQAKQNTTEQEKAWMKELQDRSAMADEELGKLNEEYGRQLDTKQSEISKEITDDMRKAIETVAKEKGLSLVVDKVAVLYGGVDVSDAVLEKLNGKKKP